jgi:hypothetical protein
MEDATPPLTMDQARLRASTALRSQSLDRAMELATPPQLAAMLAVGLGRSGRDTDAARVPTSNEAAPVGGPAASTSLDHSETSVKSDVEKFLAEKPQPKNSPDLALDAGSLSSRFRHSGWWSIRSRIFDSLKRVGASSSRIASFANCGNASWVQRSCVDETRFRLSCNHCHDRLCTPCANQRSFQLSEALMATIAGRPVTFITLTLSGKGETLGELIDRLYKHFRHLRQHPLWDEAVTGGAAFLEIKYSDKAKRWHPHLHIICEAKYIEQGQLSKAWHSITKDSFIVDIRKVRDTETTARYVTKYASKPLNMSFANSPDLLDAAVLAMKGRRLCLCFGSWYGTPLDALEDTTLADDLVDAGDWTNYMPLEEVLSRASSGDEYCTKMLISANAEARWRSMLTPGP